MSTQEKKLQEEMINLLLQKAELKKERVTDLALKVWAWNYMELFNEQELERYRSIIL
ncbi:MAG: hypothetical protein IJZ06_06295 [Bacteroidales bacterium]|nr:hypothetical protein [Bacteroidales bacterium]